MNISQTAKQTRVDAHHHSVADKNLAPQKMSAESANSLAKKKQAS